MNIVWLSQESQGKELKVFNRLGRDKMLILWILFFFGILLLLPPAIMLFFPIANLLMRILLAFLILTTVRGYLGGGTLSLIISGVLIYLLVIKWGYITASLYVFFYVLMLFNFLGVVVWGTNTLMRRH